MVRPVARSWARRVRPSFPPGAEAGLDQYRIFEQGIIIDGFKLHLIEDANQESKRRKRKGENALASGELRLADFRVFYEVEDETHIRIFAVGRKSTTTCSTEE